MYAVQRWKKRKLDECDQPVSRTRGLLRAAKRTEIAMLARDNMPRRLARSLAARVSGREVADFSNDHDDKTVP